MIKSIVAFFTAIVTFFSGCFCGFVDAVFFPEVPQTGDESNIGFWIGLAAVALGGVIATAIVLIKKKKDDENE